jgi:PhnB protein
MPDPLESFQISVTPIQPRPEFARMLRDRLVRIASEDDRSDLMTTTATATTTLSPYLSVHDAAAAIDFYVRAFGAVERYRLTGSDGRVGHADLDIAGNTIMLADEFPEAGARGPIAFGGSPVLMHLQVPDADAAVARAVEAGATIVRPVEDQFYGERGGTVADPFGHVWMVQSHIEDVTPEEMSRRWAEIEQNQPPE